MAVPALGSVGCLVGRVLPVVRTYISFPRAWLALARPLSALTFIGACPVCAALTLIGYSWQELRRASANRSSSAIGVA